MDAGRLVKIGMGLIGGGVLFVNIVHAGGIAWNLPEAFAAQMLVVVPGLVTGAVLIVGIIKGKTADRRFVGICMVLVGAMFLWADIASEASRDSGSKVFGFYKILVFGPVGVPLGIALLVIGLKIFARERLVGACMMILGAGFLPFLIYSMVDLTFGIYIVGDVLFDIGIPRYGGAVVGAVLLVPSLVLVWQSRHMPDRV